MVKRTKKSFPKSKGFKMSTPKVKTGTFRIFD